MPAGQTPHTVILFAHNDLVDKVQPGDRVNVTGKNVDCINEISMSCFFFFWYLLVSPLAWSCIHWHEAWSCLYNALITFLPSRVEPFNPLSLQLLALYCLSVPELLVYFDLIALVS